MRFKDKVVVITGASRGIGAAAAQEFAKEGAKLVLCYHENHDAMKKLQATLPSSVQSFSIAGHIADEKTVTEALKITQEKFGYADILINNAGAILGRDTITPLDFEQGMRTNLLGAILMTQAFIPLLKKREGANVVNVTSTFGIMGAAAVAVYTAAKAGVINYTKSMAVECAPHIRVNALAPGIINTDMTSSAGPDLINHFVERTPMKRLGRAEEMAKTLLFMASEDASFMTGHTLIADGGHILIN